MAWSRHTTQIDGRPAQVLVDGRFRSNAPVGQLPLLGWFGVYCRSDPGSAFWHPDETTALDNIEDDLLKFCGEFGHGWAVYALRIDTRGIREHYFYTGKGADLAAAWANMKAAHPEYRIDYDQKSDPEWERYRTFLPKLEDRPAKSFFGRLFGK